MSKALVAFLALVVVGLVYAAFHVAELWPLLPSLRWLAPVLVSFSTALLLFAVYRRRRAGR